MRDAGSIGFAAIAATIRPCPPHRFLLWQAWFLNGQADVTVFGMKWGSQGVRQASKPGCAAGLRCGRCNRGGQEPRPATV